MGQCRSCVDVAGAVSCLTACMRLACMRLACLRVMGACADGKATYRAGMTQHIETDVAIVGAGPVGLFAVFELGMLKLSSVVIDALAEVGGQCTALYPEKPIYDIPAHPAIEAGALITRLEEQIAPFRTPRLLGRQVNALSGVRGGFTLTTDQGDTVQAKAVVVAAGAGAFGPNRPPLAGLAAYEAN